MGKLRSLTKSSRNSESEISVGARRRRIVDHVFKTFSY